MTTRQITCQKARSLIPGYLDGALTLGERELLESHLATCSACDMERRNTETLDVRTRIALRAVVDDYTLTPQREAQIRRRLVQAASTRRSAWPSFTIGSLVAGIAAVLLIVSIGLGTFRPAPAPVEQPNFVSYSPGLSERDIMQTEQRQGTRIAAPVTITFLDTSISSKDYAPLVESFQAANTDVTVQVNQPDLATSDPATLADQGDCFVGNADIGGERTRDMLRPLTRYAQADAHINTDDFLPQTRELVTYNDELYGLPRTVQLRLAFFDRSALESLALPLPHVGWTSNDLAERVQELHKTLPSGQYAFLPYDGYDVVYLLTQRGVRAPQERGRLDTSATAEAINWYAELVHASNNPSLFALTDRDIQTGRQLQMAAGKAAIWTGPPVLNTSVSPRLGIVPLPVDADKPVALQADAFFISKNASSARAGACWRWVRYLSLQTFGGDRVPARYSQIHSHSFLQRFGQRQADVITAALTRSMPVERWNPITIAALTDAVDDVTLKGTPVRSSLTRVQHFMETEW